MMGIYIGIGKTSGIVFDALAPSTLLLTVISGTQINLAWTINSVNADGHSIERSLDNITWAEITTVIGVTATYNNTGLTNGLIYYYRVRAYKGTQYSSYLTTANATTWTVGEIIIRSGNTVAWYDSADLTTVTKDGSNLVSRWNDKLASGHDLIQATATNQPLWSSDGILFDGSDNYMRTATFSLVKPEFIYIVFKLLVWQAGNRRVFDGFTDGGGALVIHTSPNMYGYAGSWSTPNTGLPVGIFCIVRILFNGVSSKLIVNATTPISDNFGSNDMAGFILGAEGNITSYSNIQVKEIICRNVSDSSGDEAAIYAYLKAKHGL
jgi:hypothetical protein